AVPAAVRELFAQQPVDQAIAAHSEVSAQRDHSAVDARLDLAFEEGRVAEASSPRDVPPNAIDRVARTLARRIDPEIAEEHERVHVRPPERRGDPVAPLTIRSLP